VMFLRRKRKTRRCSLTITTSRKMLPTQDRLSVQWVRESGRVTPRRHRRPQATTMLPFSSQHKQGGSSVQGARGPPAYTLGVRHENRSIGARIESRARPRQSGLTSLKCPTSIGRIRTPSRPVFRTPLTYQALRYHAPSRNRLRSPLEVRIHHLHHYLCRLQTSKDVGLCRRYIDYSSLPGL
jgi:hypothetical protein